MTDHVRAFVLVLAAFVTSFAMAAESEHIVITRKGGGTIEGELVGKSPAGVKVKTKFGTVTVNHVDILEMKKGESPLSQYKRRRKAINDADAEQLIDLARWCEQNDLHQEARRTYSEASEVAGPHYIRSQMKLADLAMRTRDYRLAVVTWSDLAKRLRHPEAYDALRKAEDRLREERLKLWKRAEEAFAEARYRSAITLYANTLDRTVRDEPPIPGDVGRSHLIDQLLVARARYVESLRKDGRKADVVLTDKPRATWVLRTRPANLRSKADDMPLLTLRIELGHHVGRWLAVKGTYQGRSQWDQPNAIAMQIGESAHPELGVVVYTSSAQHKTLLERRRNDAYLEELLAKYPYEDLAAEAGALVKGQELVCYGRLRHREQFVPPYVLEVWAFEAVTEPEARTLAENLKKPLRCRFNETPLEAVLEFVNMVTSAEVEFATGNPPEVPITLSVDGRPTGYVVSKIAEECGLQWTRKGSKVLMKKSLTDTETALRDQVIRLASDKASR